MKFLAINIVRLTICFGAAACFAAEENWTPESVPADDVNRFLIYYQRFIHTNPFQIHGPPKNEEEKAENTRRYRQAALLNAKLSEVAAALAQNGGSVSDSMPESAPKEIKKEHANIIAGTWNLYKNIPVNAADLWQESCFLKYKSLVSESQMDSRKIETLHEFTAEIERYKALAALFQFVKRDACLRLLNTVYAPLKAAEEKTLRNLPPVEKLEKNLSVSLRLFAVFLDNYPNEDNMKVTDRFLETIQLFRNRFPDAGVTESTALLRSVFIQVQKRTDDALIKEYAEVYEGTLRRQELVGKPMPVWGADQSGNILDAATLKNKVVLLDFWATWCGPCVGEFPHLKLLYQKYREKGFEIISYNVDSDAKKLEIYLNKNPLPWTVLTKAATKQAGLPPLSGYYGAKQLPVVLLRDRDGNAVLLDARGDKLDTMLETLLDQEPH
ncbi:MAG: TlpA family protein disulfide reductase [Planctomycetaceae bacterium]|nr:TlpA family protein disulfide reductase [Planctomycetaceae bacterium]